MQHSLRLSTTWSALLGLAAAHLQAQDVKIPEMGDVKFAQHEPPKGLDTLALPNGNRFEAGLPPGRVVFDDASSPIWAEGGNYKASFAASGFTFVPYFGADAPQNYPLEISLEHAQLGTTLAPLSVASPRRQGNTVTIDRGALLERYDLTSAHVEQKFVLAMPFAGDLTLTLRVQTPLTAEREAAGLRFGNALGHVGYTSAVLVDALGRQSPMQTEYADGHITLRAPAAVIAGAVFPLTVDPIVSTFAAMTSTAHVLTESDLAFSPVSNQYFVIWTRVFSATDTDLHGVSVDLNGVVVAGSSSIIDNSLDRWDDGRVASCGANFLVVASRRAQAGGTRAIWGRTRGVGSPYTIGTAFQISDDETGDKVSPDVGGEFDGPLYFCVVWQRNVSSADHDINYRMVSLSGNTVGPVREITLGTADDDDRPRIAKTSSRYPGVPFSTQHWHVVWQRDIGNTQHDIYGARIQKLGRLEGRFAIDTTINDDTQPTVSTMTDDSRYFLVAYTTNRPGNLDIYLRAYFDQVVPFVVSEGFLAATENLTPTLRARDQFQPQVDSDGCRFAVSYLERFSATDRDAYVTTLHLTPVLAAVDARVTVTTSTFDTQAVSLVANRSVAGGRSDYGIVWDHNTTTATVNSSINGARYRGVTPGGGLATRTTSCGGLAISFAAGSQIPAPGQTIQFSLSGAPGPTIFIVGVPMPPLQLCAPASCALGATLTVMLPGPSLPLLIPCASNLVGATLAVQGAALASPGGCVALGQVVTSNTVDVTIR